MTPPRGREQWLVAGQSLLRRGGITAVKLPALTEALGLTTGSFYHHFGGMADYLDELAAYYGTEQPLAGLAGADDPDPRQRLRRLGARARDDQMVPHDAAMRDWAGASPAAARAVRQADETLLRFVEQAFVDLGHDRRGAQVRAELLLAVAVARISPPWDRADRTIDDVLDVLAPTR